MRHTTAAALAAALALAAVAPAAQAQIVQNGSFETTLPGSDPCPGSFSTVPAGGVLPGWSVSAGNVDWICSLWQHADGSRSLDMNGSAPGTIFQDVSLLPGALYELSFAMAENVGGGPDTKELYVVIESPTAPIIFGTFAFDNPAESYQQMNWQTFTRTFTANAPTMRLYFTSFTTTSCCAGPALDDVSVTLLAAPSTVPEPATVALLGAGLGVLGVSVRRRR